LTDFVAQQRRPAETGNDQHRQNSNDDSILHKLTFPFPSPYEIRNAQSQQAPDDLSAGDGLCKEELIWMNHLRIPDNACQNRWLF
jgi:hypothetical protein